MFGPIKARLYKIKLRIIYNDLRDDLIETHYLLANNLTEVEQFAENYYENNIDRAEWMDYWILKVEFLGFDVWKVEARLDLDSQILLKLRELYRNKRLSARTYNVLKRGIYWHKVFDLKDLYVFIETGEIEEWGYIGPKRSEEIKQAFQAEIEEYNARHTEPR